MPDTPAIENISHCFKIAFKDTLKGMIEILVHKFRAQEDTNEGKQEALARSIAKALRPTLTTQAPEVSTELVLTPLDIIINDIHTMGTDNGNKFYHFIVKQLTNNKSSAELDALLDTQAHEILHGWHGVFIWMAHKFQFEPESMHAAASHLGAVAGIKVFTYYVHTKCSLFDHIDQLPEALYFRSFEGDNPSSQLQKLIKTLFS